jgi:hypothetical protein
MQNNVIPIKRDNQAALAKRYLHLPTAAINEAAASAAQQTLARPITNSSSSIA